MSAHDLDDDAVCKRCGFDAAEWWHLEKQKPKYMREQQPLCSAVKASDEHKPGE